MLWKIACDDLSPKAGTQRRPPEVRPTAFTARPPDLPPRPLMVTDFAISSSLVRPGRPRYPVFVHRAAALLHAFFRPHLAMTPLRFANPSPSPLSGWIEDFHVQAVVHTRHATGSPGRAGRRRPFLWAVRKMPRAGQWNAMRINKVIAIPDERAHGQRAFAMAQKQGCFRGASDQMFAEMLTITLPRAGSPLCFRERHP